MIQLCCRGRISDSPLTERLHAKLSGTPGWNLTHVTRTFSGFIRSGAGMSVHNHGFHESPKNGKVPRQALIC